MSKTELGDASARLNRLWGQCCLHAMIFLGLLLHPATTWSQTATADIVGTVTDPAGRGIPDVKVIAKNLETGFTRETQSMTDGNFRLCSAPRWPL